MLHSLEAAAALGRKYSAAYVMGCPERIQDIVTKEKFILLLKDKLVGHSLFRAGVREFLLDQKTC